MILKEYANLWGTRLVIISTWIHFPLSQSRGHSFLLFAGIVLLIQSQEKTGATVHLATTLQLHPRLRLFVSIAWLASAKPAYLQLRQYALPVTTED